MAPKNIKKKIIEELNHLNYDIKAESLVNDLIQGGALPDDFIIDFDSRHKKNWAKDIVKAELQGNKIQLRLTRDGIVQSLPEYLFLKPVEGSKEEMDEKIAFNKQQLTYARYLFNPIENEIFSNGIFLESFEKEQIASLSFGNNKSIHDFWRINYQLNESDYIRFCKVMPGLHAVVGNFDLTADCLGYLLDTDVTVKLDKKLFTMQLDEESLIGSSGLGIDQCGNSFITGNELEENISVLNFSIGPISESEIVYYLDNGRKRNLLNCFVSYFIPVQYETEFVINIIASGSGFSLNNSYLGFNSIF